MPWIIEQPLQGANSQVKDALDPALNRVGQELGWGIFCVDCVFMHNWFIFFLSELDVNKCSLQAFSGSRRQRGADGIRCRPSRRLPGGLSSRSECWEILALLGRWEYLLIMNNGEPLVIQLLQGEISGGFQPAAAEENLHSFDSVPEVVFELGCILNSYLNAIVRQCTFWFSGSGRPEITRNPRQWW